MKKFIILMLFPVYIITGATANNPASTAGKPFTGTVTYQISYPDGKFDDNVKAMLPKILVYKVNGNKTRSEMTSSMFNQTTIYDGDTKSAVSLINMMGKKMAIKMSKEDIDKDAKEKAVPTVTLSSETREIAGYTCKKATVELKEEGEKPVTLIVFYCEELGNKDLNYQNPIFRDINGMLMEYEVITPEATMKFTATSVEKGGVTSKDFEIPADYKVTTKAEFQKQMGGGGE